MCLDRPGGIHTAGEVGLYDGGWGIRISKMGENSTDSHEYFSVLRSNNGKRL